MKFVTRWLLLSTVVGCISGGCQREARLSEKEEESLRQYVLPLPPEDMQIRLNAEFGDKLTLVGASVEHERPLRSGKELTLRLYWRADQELPKRWQLSTRLLDGAGHELQSLDHLGPLRSRKNGEQVMGPPFWEPGRVYVDEQTFRVPRSLRTDDFEIAVSVSTGDQSVPVEPPDLDAMDRVIVARLSVRDREPSRPPPLPTLRVHRSSSPGAAITIDGRLDEPEWKRAGRSSPFGGVDRKSRVPMGDRVVARWMSDDQGLLLGIEADGVTLEKRGAFDILIDPSAQADGKDYYWLRFSSNGSVSGRFLDKKPGRDAKDNLESEGFVAPIQASVTEAPGKKQKTVLEARIPWSVFDATKTTAPEGRVVWRANMFVHPKAPNDRPLAWSSPLTRRDLHRPERFGRVTWPEPRPETARETATP